MSNKQNKYAITKRSTSRCDKEFRNTKEKGDIYEQYILEYLYKEDTNRNITNRYVWLWCNIPEEVMCDVGLIGHWNEYRLQRKANRLNKLPDVGCDIFMIDNDSRYLIQCKYYAETNSVKIEDLAGWHGMLLDYPEMNGDLYYTSKLSENINARKPNPRIRYFHKLYEPSITAENNSIPIENKNKKLEPRDYQIDAYNALKNKQRTVLQLPCGMGKTLISIMLSSHYDLVIFISPLKAFCQQNEERFTAQLPDYKTEIVDSEGTRDIETLKSILAVGGKIALFATYKSVDVIMELWENVKHGYFIIDEFHNIPYDDAFNYDDGEEDYYDELEDEEEENEDLDDEDEKNGNDESEDEEEDEIDDDEESETEIESNLEEEETKSPMYKLLHSDARILFMSATPRLFEESDETAEGMDIDSEIFGEVDYSFPMGKAIEDGHICDYMVYIPTMAIKKDEGLDAVIEELSVKDYNREILIKARFIVRGCMGTGSRKCIIYCADQNECAEMSRMISDICNNYIAIDCWVDTITSNDSRDARDKKLEKFKDVKEKAFLCSVQILNECIDIPECDSIFITYASKSRIRNIQRLCRANRKDKKNPNKVASVFLWCDEYNELASFMKHVKEYDSRFTYERVKRINSGEIDSSSIMKSNSAVDDKKNLDSVSVGFKSVASWYENLEKVKKYIDENGKRPLQNDKNKTISSMGSWISCQFQNYNRKIRNMSNKYIYDVWTNFINNEKYKYLMLDNYHLWYYRFNEAKQYIDINGKRPVSTDKDKKIIALSQWICSQNRNFIKKKQAMMIDEIYNIWNKFINDDKYKNLFINRNERWFNMFNKVIEYININNKRPSNKSKNINEKQLGRWIQDQNKAYPKKIHMMRIQEIYKVWTEFKNSDKYKIIFIKDKEKWFNTFEIFKEYIKNYGKTPTEKEHSQLNHWLSTQKQTYKKREAIMQNNDVHNAWTTFIKEYEHFETFSKNIERPKNPFTTKKELWFNNFNKVKEFIDKYNKRPNSNDKNNKEEYGLGQWTNNSMKNYKKLIQSMKEPEINQTWTLFINDIKYKKYFISKEDNWFDYFHKLKIYIDTYNYTPSSESRDSETKTLGQWFSTQKSNYKDKIHSMKIPNIYDIWEQFMQDINYIKYFMSNEEIWLENFNKLKDYINKNNKKPTHESKDVLEHKLGVWLSGTNQNYKKEKCILKNENIKKIWTDFITSKEYKKYFDDNISIWKSKLILLKDYINKNNKKPSQVDKDRNIGLLGKWLSTQITNYKDKKNIMKNDEIYQLWTEFITDARYSKYF